MTVLEINVTRRNTVNAIRLHFRDVQELAKLTIASARSGKMRVTQARLRFSHQSMTTIGKGNRLRYRNRLAGENTSRRSNMSATDNANE